MNAQPLLIRPARLEDGPGVAALFGELEALHARIQPGFFRVASPGRPEERGPALMRRLLGAPDALLLLAEQPAGGGGRAGDAALVGAAFVRVHDTPDEPDLRPRRRAHVETLVVARRSRRRGIGRALMAAVERWARGRGAEQLVLTVWSGNRRAERFYHALGYRAASRVVYRELS